LTYQLAPLGICLYTCVIDQVEVALLSLWDITVSSSDGSRGVLVDYRLDYVWQSQATTAQWAMLEFQKFISVVTIRLYLPKGASEFLRHQSMLYMLIVYVASRHNFRISLVLCVYLAILGITQVEKLSILSTLSSNDQTPEFDDGFWVKHFYSEQPIDSDMKDFNFDVGTVRCYKIALHSNSSQGLALREIQTYYLGIVTIVKLADACLYS